MTMRILQCSAFVLLAIPAFTQFALAVDQTDARVSAIYETLRLSIDRLHAVEYTAHFDRQLHIALEGDETHDAQSPSKVHYDLEYVFDGNLYRSHAQYTTARDGKSYDQVWAYDGNAYQNLTSKEGILLQSAFPLAGSPMLSGMMQPIVMPFRFVFGRDIPMDFQQLQQPDPWNALARITTLGEPQVLDGHECEQVVVDTFNENSVPTKWTVLLAEDLEYFPIRLEADLEMDGVPMHNEITVQAEVIDSTAGHIVMPLHIKHLAYRSGELMLTQVYQIHPKSLQVNHAVDLSRFTIDQEQARKGVYDMDREVFTKLPEHAHHHHREANGWLTPGWLTLITANLVFFGAIAAFVYFDRNRRSKA